MAPASLTCQPLLMSTLIEQHEHDVKGIHRQRSLTDVLYTHRPRKPYIRVEGRYETCRSRSRVMKPIHTSIVLGPSLERLSCVTRAFVIHAYWKYMVWKMGDGMRIEL